MEAISRPEPLRGKCMSGMTNDSEVIGPFLGSTTRGGASKQIPISASCYSCHEQHGAVDTTFVQFYPTLLTVAKEKETLSER